MCTLGKMYKCRSTPASLSFFPPRVAGSDDRRRDLDVIQSKGTISVLAWASNSIRIHALRSSCQNTYGSFWCKCVHLDASLTYPERTLTATKTRNSWCNLLAYLLFRSVAIFFRQVWRQRGVQSERRRAGTYFLVNCTFLWSPWPGFE